ncbi:Transposon TX1 uncharacterized 149 kDa protein [Vitis vinifera]|uniref:Transposon TX1 uncharacterized 149 kDa protein n=1 Tax=Vitis vinifera TaxID=29760 RepID=A0A438HZL6_VITVI|nr:Transposon TX1 uncharacterized 149 kDa protein [Vitis vinifera]
MDINTNGILDDSEVAWLEKPFSKEVYGALLSFSRDKASGPDWFSMQFWQFSWEFVKNEVMNFFREFHRSGHFVCSLNATFIVLILKKGRAKNLRDFRPISLVGGLYKWLAKVLANGLKRVLAKVISKTQNAFVEGRQILDAVLIANKVINSILKRNGGAILWFGVKWLRWIKWCLSATRFSVLVNGTPSGFFQSSMGLRQGDPLSNYLLVIAMEALSCLLKRAVCGGFLSACQVQGRGGGANDVFVLVVDVVLGNLWVEGCKVGSLPSTYLGMPLGAPFNSVAALDDIEESFRKRLAMWK